MPVFPTAVPLPDIIPTPEYQDIAVMVSGGIDSALLYYLLHLENIQSGAGRNIVPLSVMRREGSRHFSKLVVAHVHGVLGLPYVDPVVVGDNTLPEEKQVESGAMDSYGLGFRKIYIGLIEQLPQHMVGWQPIPVRQTTTVEYPFRHLNKSHIIDLVRQVKQETLFYITHSCSKLELGRCYNCNGCNERSWAFEQLEISDPGTI
jgi:hypothetical protein